MHRFLALSVVLPALAGGTDLITFEANKPAHAREVNENFSRLDTAIQNRATKADLGASDALLKSTLNSIGQLQTGKANQADVDKSLAGKIDQAALDKGLAAKADTGALADLARREKSDVESLNASLKGALTAGSLSGIRDTLRQKSDTSSVNAFHRKSDAALADFKAKVKQDSAATASALASVPTSSNLASKLDATVFSTFQSKVKTDSAAHRAAIGAKLDAAEASKFVKLSDPFHKLSMVYFHSSTADLADGGPWYGMGRADLPALTSSPSVEAGAQMQVAGYYGLRLRSGGHILDLPEAKGAVPTLDGNELWHAGNVDPSAYVKTKGAVLEGNESNEITSVYNDNYMFDKQIGGLPSIRHALDFRWYDSHWQIGNIRSGSAPSLGFGISNGNADLRVWVGESDTRIYGNLILPTGKLAAASGSLGDLRITGTLTTAPGATPADYVFEPDYQLASLAEVEAFTKANKHLPEVPSAADMTSQGVDLAKMNMVLLKKVEELTLHAIAQEKELREQKTAFEARLQQLESLVAQKNAPSQP